MNHLKTQSLLVTLMLVFSFTSYAQLLWKITGKNLEKPSYLYGTMHTSNPKAFVLKDVLIEKISTCEAYAGEMIFEPAMMFAILPQLFMEKDTTLKTLLNEEEYRVVKEVLDEKLGMMSTFAERIKPMFTSMLLQEGSLEGLQTASPSQHTALDFFLQEEASKRNLELISLETLEEQMNVINSVPLLKQAKMLYQDVIKNKQEEKDDSMEKMLQWYAEQKLDSLYQYASKEFATEPALSYQILTKRNLNMADRIEKHINKKSVFVAIGAAHLPDKQGVIELLRKKKFKVEPVK
jgi:uncharacterized protein YbaP (TraB family)